MTRDILVALLGVAARVLAREGFPDLAAAAQQGSKLATTPFVESLPHIHERATEQLAEQVLQHIADGELPADEPQQLAHAVLQSESIQLAQRILDGDPATIALTTRLAEIVLEATQLDHEVATG